MANCSRREVQELLKALTKAVDSYDESNNVVGVDSRNQIKDDARRLVQAITSPQEMVQEKACDMTELVALKLCIRFRIFETIPVGASISADDLGKKVNVAPALIERILRVPVATGILARTRSDGGEYQHTKFSQVLVEPTKPGAGSYFQAMFDVYLRSAMYIDDWFVETRNTPYQEPDSITHNVYTWKHGHEGKAFWEVMNMDAQVPVVFHAAMSWLDHELPLTGSFFDFNELASGAHSDRIELVDIGGGDGHVLGHILTGSPALDPKKCMLQDRASVVELSKTAGFISKDVQRLEVDFHREQPIKGAKAYYMRMITHDFSDTVVIDILTHIANAMAPDSRLLIMENIIKDRPIGHEVSAAVMDAMMFLIGGKERTETGFKGIFDQSGLELVTYHHVPGTPGCLIEARRKQ